MENFGVISQKKWNCYFVTRCHVPEEMKRPLRDGVSYPRRNETATQWRGPLLDAVSFPRRNETVTPWRSVTSHKKWKVTPWRGVTSQKKRNGHSVTRCHVPEEMKRSLRDAVSHPRRNETATPWRGVISQKKLNGHSVTRWHPRRNETVYPWSGVISQKFSRRELTPPHNKHYRHTKHMLPHNHDRW